MKLYIKNTSDKSSNEIVKHQLEKLGLTYSSIELGNVSLKNEITAEQRIKLKIELFKSGLELINTKKTILIEKIKNTIKMFLNSEEPSLLKFSDFLSQHLSLDYTYLSHLFSKVIGTSIEHYLIANKIEMVKQLLLLDELNLSEISYKLHYSSVAHLSRQFKKETGQTSTSFKNFKNERKLPD